MKLERPFQILSTAPTRDTGRKSLRVRVMSRLRMFRQHQIFAVGQRSAEALERLAPHDDHVAHRRGFEPLEILRQMPGNFIPRADPRGSTTSRRWL